MSCSFNLKYQKRNNNTTIIKWFLKPINHFCSNSQEANGWKYIFVKRLCRHLPLRNLTDFIGNILWNFRSKKRDAPSKDFWTHCTVGTGVVKRWRGEDVGRHLCLTSQLRQVSTAIFLLNIRKKIRRWENGTLNNFKLQEFGLTLSRENMQPYFTLDMKIKINFYYLNWHKSPRLFSCGT